MYLPLEGPLEKLTFQNCNFPTSTRGGEAGQFEGIRVFDRENLYSDLGRDHESLENAVKAAWAILLRSYLQDDTVTYAVLFDSRSAEFCEPHLADVPLSAETEVLIVQYQLHNSHQLKDICAAACLKCSRQALGQIQINTAINLCIGSASGHGKENSEHSKLRDFQPDNLVEGFDLVLNWDMTSPLEDVFISYRCPKVSRTYSRAIANTFQTILEGILSYRDCKIGDLDVVSKEDKQRMLSWNPKAIYAQMTCMHYLVEATARVIPDAEAVCAWDGSCTYSQLDALSSIAAESLFRTGVGPGVFVPFAYEKSLWTVVATLAILKAGGALVPLDPTHPRARLEEILNGLHARIVVASDAFASSFRDLVEHVVVISALTVSTHNNNRVTALWSSIVGPNDPVFVLFTSGSSGSPKGIIHEHGAICTHAIAHGEAMGYHRARVLQFAAHTFNVALIDIFTTLVFGGCICIPSEEERRNDIIGAINSMKANYALLTPSFAALIEPSEVPTLKTLAIGGEAISQEHIQRWADRVSLISIYGPAEVGICLTIPMYPGRAPPETVGYTLPNSSCWLVDPDNPHRLVPIGAVGEMVVAGPSLARCYLNDEGKTRASFVENLAWADDIGLKLRFYKTGDLLRYNTTFFDGSYDFVRRKDTQIKIRGQRVESGEVEHHIASIPGVAVSMVTHPKQGCFADELVAVVQMRSTETPRIMNESLSISSNQSLSIETIKAYLSEALPSYMIPTVCLVITSMPFVPSMKIDRRRVDSWLTTMDTRPAELAKATLVGLNISRLESDEITANKLSVKVAELVGRKDKAKSLALANHDFILQKAGIDSIQIISLSMFLQRTYSIKVPMEKLLSSKLTIRDLAYLVDHQEGSSSLSDVSAIVDIRQESRLLSKRFFHDIEVRDPSVDSGVHISGPDIPIRNVFLTGASGFLGSAILQHLLARPNIRIFALVRCSSRSEGLQRIIQSAARKGRWEDRYASRIYIWPGDLTEANFGLDTQQLQCLYGTSSQKDLQINAVIHNGARVHYSSDYETLKPTNVLPTIELLKIMAQAPRISTFVFVSGGLKPNASGQECVSRTNGYAQSKVVSERLVGHCVEHAAFHSKQLYTIKPGYIIGAASAGIANHKDFIWRLIASCVEINAYNVDEAAHWLYISDTDRVACSVISTLFDSAHLPSGAVERVLDGLRFSDLWKTLEEEFGWELKPVRYEDWMARLRARIDERQEDHLLFPLLHVLERDGGKIGSSQEVPAPKLEVAAKSTAIVRKAIIENVRHLIEAGFFPEPRMKQK